MRNSKKKSIRKFKIEKRDLTVDEVMIQSALIMVNTISDTKRDGATVKFETESNGDIYHVDIVISKVKAVKPAMNVVKKKGVDKENFKINDKISINGLETIIDGFSEIGKDKFVRTEYGDFNISLIKKM